MMYMVHDIFSPRRVKPGKKKMEKEPSNFFFFKKKRDVRRCKAGGLFKRNSIEDSTI